jgi:hypothetical protein
VGENSSGKSTLLALTRIVWDLATEGRADFNEEPFLLGGYEQIATQEGTLKAADSFTVGMKLSEPHPGVVLAKFTSQKDQPALRRWSYKTSDFRLEVEYDPNERPASLKFENPSGTVKIGPQDFSSVVRVDPWSLLLHSEPKLPKPLPPYVLSPEVLGSHFSGRSAARPYAFAPIRTRPQRTYDPIKEAVTPEGSHIPLTLQGLFRDRDRDYWDGLIRALDGFGRASGLFGKVNVKKVWGDPGSPFQIQISIDDALRNFVDVGYGVSQALPIIVDCLLRQESTFLLQQPEVHLHPKAQAELSSFLALLAKEEQKQFLIETHSDYLVDRIRMDVRDGKHGLRPEDVLILYFERQGGVAHIYPMHLDAHGNLLDAPPTYRRFFLEEERRFLGG